jgi:hypothetical protein
MIISCKPRFGVRNNLRPSIPLPSFGRRQSGPIKRRAMTIGIGMVCAHGAVIATDTMVTGSDGLSRNQRKIFSAKSKDGAFVIAFSADDVDAIMTLIENTFEGLVKANPETLFQVEEIVRGQMYKWVSLFPHQSPQAEFIVGASVPALWDPDAKVTGGVGLYHCVPPSTMNKKHFLERYPHTYLGIGVGATITDPLAKTFFRGMQLPIMTLKQISYLMYRAKKDFASVCGGATNAIFLRELSPAAFEVLPAYMDKAERLGPFLDMQLGIAAGAILSSHKEQALGILEQLRTTIDLVAGYKNLQFLTGFNQQIGEDGIVTQLGFQTSEGQP